MVQVCEVLERLREEIDMILQEISPQHSVVWVASTDVLEGTMICGRTSMQACFKIMWGHVHHPISNDQTRDMVYVDVDLPTPTLKNVLVQKDARTIAGLLMTYVL